MRRDARRALIGIVLLSAFVLVWEFQGFLYPAPFARWRATRVMEAHCRQWHLDTKLLVGPTREKSPGGLWYFRWKYNGSPKGTMVVVLGPDGSSVLDGEQLDD